MITVAAEIAAPAEAVWALLADPARWPEWGPSVTAVDAPEGAVAPGTRGRVRTPVGVWLPFTVAAVEPGRSWHWRVAGIPATGHRVEPAGAGRCRVVFEVPVWAAPYAAVCRLALARIADAAPALAP